MGVRTAQFHIDHPVGCVFILERVKSYKNENILKHQAIRAPDFTPVQDSVKY